jgi:hypothetical protein
MSVISTDSVEAGQAIYTKQTRNLSITAGKTGGCQKSKNLV